MTNFVILWKFPDTNAMSTLSSRFRISGKMLKFIFDNYLTDSHDSIIINNTRSKNKDPQKHL